MTFDRTLNTKSTVLGCLCGSQLRKFNCFMSCDHVLTKQISCNMHEVEQI